MREDGQLIGGVLSAQYLQAVGQVAVESSKLEAEIEFFIWLVLHVSEQSGRVITDRLQLEGKLAMLRELVNMRTSTVEMRADWKDITDKISDLIPKRNTAIHRERYGVLHAIFKRLPRSKSYPIAVRHKRSQKNIPVVQAADIKKIAIRLACVRVQLQAFYLARLEELVPPSPSKA